MTATSPKLPQEIVTTAKLRRDQDTGFALTPGAEDMAAIAADLGLDGLRKLRFTGTLKPVGRSDILLAGHLGATVVQPCVVTLAPVTTRIEAEVIRTYVAEMPEPSPEEDEVEMPEDETLEPLGRTIDLAGVMIEALALNLPLYPRAEGADLGEAVFAAPGVAPMKDEETRPFAGLAGLRDALKDGQDEGD